MENYIMLNGKKIELTQEQINLIIDGKNDKVKSVFDRAESDGIYYYIEYGGNVEESMETEDAYDDICYNIANYCTDGNLIQQQAWSEQLNRLLWRYSMTHDGDKIDWYDSDVPKYLIQYNKIGEDFDVDANVIYRGLGSVYFYSADIAYNAIQTIVKPFIESHPDFVF